MSKRPRPPPYWMMTLNNSEYLARAEGNIEIHRNDWFIRHIIIIKRVKRCVYTLYIFFIYIRFYFTTKHRSGIYILFNFQKPVRPEKKVWEYSFCKPKTFVHHADTDTLLLVFIYTMIFLLAIQHFRRELTGFPPLVHTDVRASTKDGSLFFRFFYSSIIQLL